jgi:hypothetical protein
MGLRVGPNIAGKRAFSKMERTLSVKPFKNILENRLSRIAQEYLGKTFTVKINASEDSYRCNFNINTLHLDGFCAFLKIFKENGMIEFIGGLELTDQPRQLTSSLPDKTKNRQAFVLKMKLIDLEGFLEDYLDKRPAIRKEVGLDPELLSLFPQLPKQP